MNSRARYALEKAKHTLRRWQTDLPSSAWVEVEGIILDIDTALAEPVRHCDIGTPDEQSVRFDAHCQKHMGCSTCPLREKDGGVPKHCEFAWGAMPYTKGGAR